MFFLKSGASKYALNHLCTKMNFELIDVQIPTTLMENFGAYPMRLTDFLDILRGEFKRHLNNLFHEKILVHFRLNHFISIHVFYPLHRILQAYGTILRNPVRLKFSTKRECTSERSFG